MFSMRPIGVMTGGEGRTLPSEGMGYIWGLEHDSTFEWVTATQDAASIKIYLDTKNQNISLACMQPTTSMGQANIANISSAVRKSIHKQLKLINQWNYIG